VSLLSDPITRVADALCSSEKSDRIFGTLVITLPSAHAGGDLSVFHAGELRHQCRTSLYSEFDTTYLAW
jgi:hypothetical protein